MKQNHNSESGIFNLRVLLAFGLCSVGALLVIIALAVPALAATTWIVTSTGDDVNDPTTLRGALHVANSGDTIDLTGLTGTITLTNGQLFVSPSVAITGPGASNLAISGNHSSRIFDIGAGAIVTISGVTIENGNGNQSTTLSDTVGGGIRNTGTLTLTDCIISGNSATESGGGVYNFPGKFLSVISCTFSNNSAFSGGGIFNDASGGTVSVSDSKLSGNSAFEGAGIYNSGGTLVVASSTLSGNTAGTADALGSGAGIFSDGNAAYATVTDSTLSDNTIVSEPNGGTQGGSALTNFSGQMTVTRCTLSGNSGNSGSMWNEGTLVVTNSTFSGNDAVILNQATASFTNSTLAGNTGGFGSTGGILNAVHGTVTLKNTLLANSPQKNCDNVGTITSQDHNISDDTTCSAFLIQPHDFAPGTNPGLDTSLKDNGGPTKTIALLPGSVAVDAINPSSDSSVSTDQRGVSRPQGRHPDIGAFEATPDFYFTPISAITTTVGGSDSRTVQVNSFVGFSSAVSLTVPGAPAGFSTSFSTSPVTPASYGFTSSALAVNIGPSVSPGSFTLNVTGTSGALSHSTPLKVTVSATSGGVTQVVGTDLAAGCIDNSGTANAVKSKLAEAQADINAGNIQQAKSVLNDLLNYLQAQRGKHIKTSCTVNGVTFDPDAVLIADVQALLASL
jgi:hypothetical protein